MESRYENVRETLGGDLQNRDALLNETAVARILGMSVRTLQGWRLRGEGPPFVKIRSAVRYQVREVLNWIEEQKVRSTSEAAERGHRQ